MNRWVDWAGDPGSQPAGTALARGAAGLVFVVSGAVKLVHDNQGIGRFTKLGFPSPGTVAGFVGVVEIVFGALLLVGLLARLAALILAADMVVAIAVTKLPLLWGPGPEPVSAPPKTSVLAFLYQARLDLTMLAVTVAVVLYGAGLLSLDARRRRREAQPPRASGDRAPVPERA